MNILLNPCYFAPISQYAIILKAKKIYFEIFDNYQKQTFRNRCYIAGPQGKLMLNIPVKHNKNAQKKLTKDAEIDYESSFWQKNHLRSLQISYRSSPYFEFFEDEITKILDKKYKFLLDLNMATFEFVMDALQESRNIFYTEKYENTLENSQIKDCRNLTDAKKKIVFEKKYKQIFQEKYDFLNNLSILDLLFMQGPSSPIYLQDLKIKRSKNR